MHSDDNLPSSSIMIMQGGCKSRKVPNFQVLREHDSEKFALNTTLKPENYGKSYNHRIPDVLNTRS